MAVTFCSTRSRRIRGRPLSDRAQEYGFRFGLAVVLLLMVFATYNDMLHLCDAPAEPWPSGNALRQKAIRRGPKWPLGAKRARNLRGVTQFPPISGSRGDWE